MPTLADNVPIESTDPQPLVNTAVIVAAGRGSRLCGNGGKPKPLVEVAGVPLIARVMADAARAGIRRFVVVIGDQSERMRQELPGLVPAGCALELIENPRFEEPNGLSLVAAAATVKQPFALLMSDHLFSPARLRAAREAFQKEGRSLLVIERADSFAGDLGDATRVETRRGRVSAIGKELQDFDAIDSGMFVLQPEALARAIAVRGSSPSISDVIHVMAEAGEMDGFDPQIGEWQDVDTPADLKLAEGMLYRSLSKPSDGFLARLINRRVSLFFSKRLWGFGVTPNMVTAFTLVLGLGAGAAFAQGNDWRWGLLGATLFQLQSIIDGVDGELARLLNRESRFGFWFDLGVDNLTHIAVFSGIALGQSAAGIEGPWTLLGAVAVGGVIASFVSVVPLLHYDPSGRSDLPAASRALTRRIVESLTGRDFTYLLFPAAILGWLGSFLWVAAAGTWAFAAVVVLVRTVLPRFELRNNLRPTPGEASP